MEQHKEELEPQKTPEGAGTPETPEETVTLSKTELEELKHRAEVSSQNFERAKKAENEAKELRDQIQEEAPPDAEEYVKKSELQEIKEKLNKSEVLVSHPLLKETWSEFEEFRSHPDNRGMNIRTAAKAFYVEKGLLDPQRKGLEKPTGGPKTPLASGMSAEDVKRLRESNYRKYQEMLKKGQIKIS